MQLSIHTWWKRAFLCLVAASLGVPLCLSAEEWLRPKQSRNSLQLELPPLVDDSLSRRLLRATVCIAPKGDAFHGCGVLVDSGDRLVVTLKEVMGEREEAKIWLATAVESQPKIAARVAHRQEIGGLIVCRLERMPEGAQPLKLGEWSRASRQVFHSLHQPAAESSWSYTRGLIRAIHQPPHY